VAVRDNAALAAKDQTIEILREQIAFLQEQVRALNDRLMQMADPMAAARAAQLRARADLPGIVPPSRAPSTSPSVLRMRLRDIPSKDELDRLISIQAEERAREIAASEAPSSAGRGEVEASFTAPGS